jgi:RimJ/RimL family protein N-acetyltransferase
MILDLKGHPELLPQYVELRNRYCELLLTQPVAIAETRGWLHSTTTEIRCIADGDDLLGVVLLYIDRGGEVAFFARQVNRGIGTQLLHIADDMARQKKLTSIWAWVRKDNAAAVRVFEKCGYQEVGNEGRYRHEQLVDGIRFTKTIEENNR